MGVYEKHMKRMIDIVISLSALLALVPALIAIAIIIKIEDKGDSLYRGIRVGKGGREFNMYKFRTMVMNATDIGGSSTSDYDPRITNIGRALRKYKLDELPQLINVLKGDMSIVGPRPEVEEYVNMYNDDEKRILRVRPGITDWASLWNPDEGAVLSRYPDPDKAYLEIIRPKKLELQKKYVDELSFINDMRIIIMTMRTIIRREVPVLEEIEPPGGNTLDD